MRRLGGAVLFGVLAGCNCAGLNDGLLFKCDVDADCVSPERCATDKFCRVPGGTAGGSSAGGSSAGGSSAGGSSAGGSSAGGGSTAGGSTAGGGSGTAGGASGGTSGGAGGTAGGSTAGGIGAAGGSSDGGCVPGSFDIPDDNFIDSNCDGIDGTAQGGIFVAPSPLGNDATGTGSMTRPFATLQTALNAAGSSNHSIYVATATYSLGATLTWSANVSIFGGYVPTADGGWPRLSGMRALIAGPSSGVAMRVGTSPSNSRVLDSVNVTASMASASSNPSIALVVERTGLTLRHVNLQGNTGGNGVPGMTGADGADGGRGSNGNPGSFTVDGGAIVPFGGAPGASPCNPGFAGGAGSVSFAQPGGPGGGPQPALGSGSGASPCSSCPCMMPNFTTDGDDGLPGADGDAGTVGATCNPAGLVNATTWQPVNGAAGTPGEHGKGGGGGGGVGAIILGSSGAMWLGGSSGAGGAGAGCAGSGGAPGGSGGASIGLLIIGGRVNASTDVLIATARGGVGAPGGAGGRGGRGGPLAIGGPSLILNCDGMGGFTLGNGNGPSGIFTGNGGNGGRGGNGGPGGSGADGCGGPSFGVLCSADGGVSIPGSSITVPPMGGGGSGGPSGLTGARGEIVGCAP